MAHFYHIQHCSHLWSRVCILPVERIFYDFPLFVILSFVRSVLHRTRSDQ